MVNFNYIWGQRTFCSSMWKSKLALVLLMTLQCTFCVRGQSNGSRCPGVTCATTPPGAQCYSSYNRDNGCCPLWTCNDGRGGSYTIYGMSAGSGSGHSSSYSYSSGSSGGTGGQQSGFNIQSFNFNGLNNGAAGGMLSSIFGGLFGRRR